MEKDNVGLTPEEQEEDWILKDRNTFIGEAIDLEKWMQEDRDQFKDYNLLEIIDAMHLSAKTGELLEFLRQSPERLRDYLPGCYYRFFREDLPLPEFNPRREIYKGRSRERIHSWLASRPRNPIKLVSAD